MIAQMHFQALLALEVETAILAVMLRIRTTAYVLLLLRFDGTRHLTHIVLSLRLGRQVTRFNRRLSARVIHTVKE